MSIRPLARRASLALVAVALVACPPQEVPTATNPRAPAAGSARGLALPDCTAAGARRFEGSFARAAGGSPEVEPMWLAAHRCEVRMVDVREADERAGPLGSIDGSEHAPLEELDRAAANWRSDEPIVFVCRSGRRSERAVDRARSLGLRRVASLTGGMLAWASARLPTVRDAPRASAAGSTGTDAPAARNVAMPRSVYPTAAELRAELERPGAIVWTPASTLLGSGRASCIDGRSDAPVLGAPGGDVGELVLSLSALEQELGRELDAEWIVGIFDRYVESFGRFYLHTDRHALERLREVLRRDGRFERASLEGSPEALLSLVRAPPLDLESPLLELLIRHEHIGCGHLRLMSEHPARYGVREGLVASVLRAAFTRGWRQPELIDLEVLEGAHEERGVLEVRVDTPVHAHSLVPMVTPRGSSPGLFVVHPQVADFLRAETAEFLTEQLAPDDARRVRPERLRARTDALGARQLRATVDALAPHLPHYVLRASERGHELVELARVRTTL